MQEETETLFVTEQEAGERLDKILATRLSQAGSRTYFQFLIEEEKVLLNGLPAKKRIKLQAGDEIEIEYVLNPELTLQPENLPLKILYEDDSILVVDKAAGMVVHPAVGNWTGTFANALLFHCGSLGNEGLRPGIVHRLDKDTSGVLIAAKTLLAQQKLIEMFAERLVYKEYLAICLGNPKEGVIETFIGRHPVHRKMMAVLKEGGRNACTHYHSLYFNEQLSLVSLVIKTGRTHQIRVHMQHHGTPVLGDAIYGNSAINQKQGIKRQMLHAYKLGLLHPISGHKMEFIAEIPEDMQKIIGHIRRNS
jgi:23S rRNA pseudouridine1911/1915/1917 synthase